MPHHLCSTSTATARCVCDACLCARRVSLREQRCAMNACTSCAQEVRASVRATIDAVDIGSHTWTAAINKLIVSYLAHRGCPRTARAYADSTATPMTESEDAIIARSSTCGIKFVRSIFRFCLLLSFFLQCACYFYCLLLLLPGRDPISCQRG